MIEREGDLFNTTSPCIGHGVNIDGVMGSGIAKQFSTLWPEMYRQYRMLCFEKLLHPGEVFIYETPNFLIYNIASQDRPGRNASLTWLEDGLAAALSDVAVRGYEMLALPRIGCGIGGLDWEDVRPLILDLELCYDVDTEIWTLPEPVVLE